MAIPNVFENFDLIFNASDTENLLIDDAIDSDANIINDSKFQKLDSPYYNPGDLIAFSKEYP